MTKNINKEMNSIFGIVRNILLYISKKTKLTYNEINIIVYYFIVPFTWVIILDFIFRFHYLKVFFIIFTLVFFIGCRNFRRFSDWLFEKSVNFLNSFNRLGISYVSSSVWICVAIPILIYSILFMIVFNLK